MVEDTCCTSLFILTPYFISGMDNDSVLPVVLHSSFVALLSSSFSSWMRSNSSVALSILVSLDSLIGNALSLFCRTSSLVVYCLTTV